MSQDDLIATLKAAAEKATPGTITAHEFEHANYATGKWSGDGTWFLLADADGANVADDMKEADAKFHALTSSANITLLLNYIAAKDAIIASLRAEISKQNKAEDELLATGEKLAEERNL